MNSTSSTTPTTFPSSTSTTSSPAETTTSTFLSNSTDPDGFAFQAFSDRNYAGSASPVIRDELFTDFDFNGSSYVWIPNFTDCCVTFCANKTSSGWVGWWCPERRQPNASHWFERIYVGCGDDGRLQENGRCV